MKRVVFYGDGERRRSGFGLADLLVAVVLIPLLAVAVLARGRRMSRDPSNRVKYASNLRQVGRAIRLYSNENGGDYPRPTCVRGDVVQPVWGTGAPATKPFDANGTQPNDVSAAIFLLIRTQ